MAGKGDRRRPSQVTYDQWTRNYERIFGSPEKREKEKRLRLKALAELTAQAQELNMGY